MALQVDFTMNGVTYTNAYVTTAIKNRHNKSRNMSILVCFYANGNFSKSNPQSPFFDFIINVNKQDYDQYFSVSALSKLDNNIEKACYDFLKSIDPEEEGCLYTICPVDFKNDSTDI